MNSVLYLMGGLHCVIGLAAAAVAHSKGRSLKLWLPLGLVCGTPSLIVALLMKREENKG
ncbi:MAG TPA: hypothetical protein V6C88_11485 [Chroococcidiopsis sp.]